MAGRHLVCWFVIGRCVGPCILEPVWWPVFSPSMTACVSRQQHIRESTRNLWWSHLCVWSWCPRHRPAGMHTRWQSIHICHWTWPSRSHRCRPAPLHWPDPASTANHTQPPAWPDRYRTPILQHTRNDGGKIRGEMLNTVKNWPEASLICHTEL